MKPHIVIDARLYGPKHTGIGRYTKNLLVALKNDPNFSKYTFTLLIYPELKSEIQSDLGKSFDYLVTNLKHYSLAEQFLLPLVLVKLKPDLVHFTHLDKPILYFGKSIVTVHDLIRHFSKGSDTTTHSSWLYWIKYLGYLFMTRVIFWTSSVIVPSNYWRDYLLNNFRLSPTKVTTTYEAVDPAFLKLKNVITNSPDNYLLYTGNLYPHKNIKVVLEALKKLPQIRLKIICARSIFSQKISQFVAVNKLEKQVDFLGYVPDTQFPKIYSRALALVHPSLIEGFSLTGLEAMSLSCPVIASNASCLPEIYQDSVLYFDPYSADDLVKQIRRLTTQPRLRSQLIRLGHIQVAQYSWNKCATQTLNAYQATITTS